MIIFTLAVIVFAISAGFTALMNILKNRLDFFSSTWEGVGNDEGCPRT
jgi:hypothetical protein